MSGLQALSRSLGKLLAASVPARTFLEGAVPSTATCCASCAAMHYIVAAWLSLAVLSVYAVLATRQPAFERYTAGVARELHSVQQLHMNSRVYR